MNDVHMTAKFVKQLRERALDLSSVLGPEAAEMKLNTESYCEELETHLQAEFFAATEQSNYSTMKRCAETLEELSGLHSENVLISNVRPLLQSHTRHHSTLHCCVQAELISSRTLHLRSMSASATPAG